MVFDQAHRYTAPADLWAFSAGIRNDVHRICDARSCPDLPHWLPAMVILLYALGADVWIDKPQKVYWLVFTAMVCLGLNYALMRLARSSGRCGNYLRRSWIGHRESRANDAGRDRKLRTRG